MELFPPWIPITAIGVVAVLAVSYSLRSRLITGQFGFPSSLSLVAAIVLFGTVAFMSWDQQGRSGVLIPSPNGANVARVIVGGILDSKAYVIVRKPNQLSWHRVYAGPGYLQDDSPAYPYIEWTDGTHLAIHVHASAIQPTWCVNRVEAITIECRADNW